MNPFRLFLVVLLGLPLRFYSQNEDYGIFRKCEITRIDGTLENGFIAFFLEVPQRDKEDIYLSSLEHVINLDDNNFEFKTTPDSPAKSLSQKDVKAVKIYERNGYTALYKLMDVRTLADNGSVKEDSSKKAWLRVVKEDVVALYQANIYLEKNRFSIKENDFDPKKTKKLMTVTYLSNPKENIAFEIYNIGKRRVLFRRNLSDNYLAKVFRHVFKDCPGFISKKIPEKEWEYKPYTTSDDSFDDQIKKIKNSELDEFKKFAQIDVLESEKEAQPFLKLIEEYKSNCP